MVTMDVLTFRGNRNEWIDFIASIKKERKEVWDVLGPFIRDYPTLASKEEQ